MVNEGKNTYNFVAEVVVPVPLDTVFSYGIPNHLVASVAVGSLVLVSFGKNQHYAGIVVKILECGYSNLSLQQPLKAIAELLEDTPIVTHAQIEFWYFLAHYYCCPLGAVMQAALPSSFKLERKHVAFLNENADRSLLDTLSFREQVVYNALKNKPLSINKLEESLGKAFSFLDLKKLLAKSVVSVEETLVHKSKLSRPQKPQFIEVVDFDMLDEVQLSLSKKPKQLALLAAYRQLAEATQGCCVKISSLLSLSQQTSAVLSGMIKKGIFVTSYLQGCNELQEVTLPTLNVAQATALSEINVAFKEHMVTLLYGVTASGKTALYCSIIAQTLRSNHQALLLLPEIALTTQMLERLKAVFGHRVICYHSRLSSTEREAVWRKVLAYQFADEGFLITGTRSALFLPFKRLGLIIVDEEHEPSFKQNGALPQYHARDAAIMLAKHHQVKVLLGSATPSAESYYNAVTKKYGYVQLLTRYNDHALPSIEIVNTQIDQKYYNTNKLITFKLYDAIKNSLEAKHQVILFHNRRGYLRIHECKSCGWVLTCEHCDVSLTEHKSKGCMLCHYCGYTTPLVNNCPNCVNGTLSCHTYGSEKVEEAIKALFPGACVGRIDSDVAQKKYAVEQVLQRFEAQKIDILIGTQMAAKGLDFSSVATAGVLNVDMLLHFPDFRAHERTMQLLTQVSGRTGRQFTTGLAIVQTSNPKHAVLEAMLNSSYQGFMDEHLKERKLFDYPPFTRLIKLTLKDKDQQVVFKAADVLSRTLKDCNFGGVLGPAPPVIARVANYYKQEILLKLKRCDTVQSRLCIKDCIKQLKQLSDFKRVYVHINVDPL